MDHCAKFTVNCTVCIGILHDKFTLQKPQTSYSRGFPASFMGTLTHIGVGLWAWAPAFRVWEVGNEGICCSWNIKVLIPYIDGYSNPRGLLFNSAHVYVFLNMLMWHFVILFRPSSSLNINIFDIFDAILIWLLKQRKCINIFIILMLLLKVAHINTYLWWIGV